jgi:hypothetical protein
LITKRERKSPAEAGQGNSGDIHPGLSRRHPPRQRNAGAGERQQQRQAEGPETGGGDMSLVRATIAADRFPPSPRAQFDGYRTF